MAAAIDQKSILNVGGTAYEYHRLDAVAEGHVARLPFSLKILLEISSGTVGPVMSAKQTSAHWPTGIHGPNRATKLLSRRRG